MRWANRLKRLSSSRHARRGYRFIAPVDDSFASSANGSAAVPPRRIATFFRQGPAIALLSSVLIAVIRITRLLKFYPLQKTIEKWGERLKPAISGESMGRMVVCGL
jgi:hypothetical protein